MAEILPPNMAAFLQQALSPDRQREMTLAAAMRAGLLNPDTGSGPVGAAAGGAMPQSPQESQELAADAQWSRGLGAATGFSPAMRASEAVQQDRPLEAAGNAAVAAIPFRPLAGAGALGATYGAAIGADILPGMFGTPEAEAQSRNRQPAPAQPPAATLPGLNAEQQKLFNDTQKRISAGGFSSGAERRQLEQTMQDLRAISSDFTKAQNAATVKAGADKASSAQDEYNRAVGDAENARSEWEARD